MSRRFFVSRVVPGLLTVLGLISAPGAARADRSISLTEAIELAVKQNPELRLESAKVAEAEAKRKGTRGLYGPKLAADANLLVWDSALPFDLHLPDFGDPNFLPGLLASLSPEEQRIVGPVLGKYEVQFGELMPVFEALLPKLFNLGNIRDQVTSQIQLTLAQPITPLLQIDQGYRATKKLAESASLDRSAKCADVVYKVREAYLRLMRVQRLAEVAKTGVDQVQQHLTRAKHFNSAGLIGKQEVLKAQLELARARERFIKATYGIDLASSALAVQLGLSVEERLTPTETVQDPPPQLTRSLAQLTEQAMKSRPELKSMERKQGAAEADRKRAKWDLIPQISAIATYQHNEGQGTLMPKNAFFGGGVLKWDLWDWGNKWYNMKAASARQAQAEAGERMLRDGVSLQTKKAYLDLKQSDEALTVARAAIQEAEENFRIEQRRFEANANTSTDVLDAQLALTRAKLSYTSALYGYYIARAALQRASGYEEL